MTGIDPPESERPALLGAGGSRILRLARPIIPLLLLLLIFIGGGVFIASQWTSATRNRDLIDRSHRVIETSLTMVKEMVDAETAQRGYVITGDDAFLTPFKAAEISVPERFHRQFHVSRIIFDQ